MKRQFDSIDRRRQVLDMDVDDLLQEAGVSKPRYYRARKGAVGLRARHAVRRKIEAALDRLEAARKDD